MKILVTGASGQVGGAVAEILKPHYEVWGSSRTVPTVQGGQHIPMDLAKPSEIEATIREVGPSIIVNCGAYTNVDGAEREADAARAVNSIAPGVIGSAASELDAFVIHFSTDYVFDGSGTRARVEGDAVGPLSVYGETKLEGERSLEASGCNYAILRTSWVFDARGKNFVNTVLRLAKEKNELSIVDDQIGAPTSASELARIVRVIVERVFSGSARWLEHHNREVFHCSCAGETSWCGFAEEIVSQARARGLPLAIERVKGIPTSEYPTLARRPLNSRLSMAKIESAIGTRPRAWQVALKEVLAEIEERDGRSIGLRG